MLRCGRVRVSAFAAALVVAASLPGVSAPAAVDLPEILVSRQLAQEAALREGDIVTFAVDAAGSGATRVRVVGIYEPTPNPMRFHLAVAVVTVLGSTAFLLALMVMRAEERRETIGIIRLIGVSQRSILLGVLVEGLLIATAGALFGILVAVATEGAVNRFFQWRYDTTLVFVRVTASIALKSIALSVPLGVAAGLAGSWTLLRRDVVALIRR